MYLVRTPSLVRRLFPAYLWRGRRGRRAGGAPTVYLTFDDGPIPEVTPWVLEQLAAYRARATFFCVGENAARHPHLLAEIRAAGHSLGNHTHTHLSGWTAAADDYLANVDRCADLVDSPLFRPPYGRLRLRQAQALHDSYRVVMWDVLSGDFDRGLSPEDCLANVVDNVTDGSIVVFHDSLKSEPNLRYALPGALAELSARGYRFAAVREVSARTAAARAA